MTNNLPKRKPTRLKGYDYSNPGAYFVTICTHNRKCVLSDIVGEGLCALPQNRLTPIGKETEKSIQYINDNYVDVTVDKYVIMPNHIHLIVILNNSGGHGDPPLQNIIGQLKSYTTNKYGDVLWQRSFHDHIIRGQKDYQKNMGIHRYKPIKMGKRLFLYRIKKELIKENEMEKIRLLRRIFLINI